MMKRNLLLVSAFALILFGSVFYACQKDDVETYADGAMLKSSSLCCVERITPETIDVYGGGNPQEKIGEIKIWNDAYNVHLTIETFDFDNVKVVGPLASGASEPKNKEYNIDANLITKSINSASKDYAYTTYSYETRDDVTLDFCTEYRFWVKIEGKAGGAESYSINYTPVKLETIAEITEAPEKDVCMGEEVSITAQVTATATITNGTLKIMDGGTELASAEVSSENNAVTYIGDGLTVGSHSITAKYIPDHGFCEDESDEATTVTILDNAYIQLTSDEGTDSQTGICVNTGAIEDITYTIGGSATGAYVEGLPQGVLGNLVDDIFTISGTPTETGTFEYTVYTEGPCETPSLSGSITVENCGGCEESFSYVDNGNNTYTFTYIPGEDIEDALLTFTFPQSSLDNPLEGWTYNGQTMQTTMSLEACPKDAYTWKVTLTCKDLNNPQNKWTDFTVNGVSKKGELSNIKCE